MGNCIKNSRSLCKKRFYLIENENADPFYQKPGMKFSDDVMQYNKIEWTGFTVE